MYSSQLTHHRHLFPALSHSQYFNYGGQGPISVQAIEAISQAYQTLQEIGPFSAQAQHWLNQTAQQTRHLIGAELGVASETISLTENVSVGCNIVLWGMHWQAGDHLLISDCEHPGIVAAVQELQRRFNLEVSICPLLKTLNGGDPVAVISDFLQPNTRLVVLSHILWNTGQILPLKAIVAACHRYAANRSLHVLVDAAQSVGVLPLDLQELQVDFYAFTGHKWWCGPAGVGGLYVRPDVLAELQPTMIAWRGITIDAFGNPTGWKPDGQRFEIATSAYPLYAGLSAAIQSHQAWGDRDQRYQRIQTLSKLLWQKLAAIPQLHCLRTTPPEAGLVSFQLENQNPAKLVGHLEQQGILVRTILSPVCVRACTHYLTLESEIDRLVEAIIEFLKTGHG